jgi:hypothetical protein
MQQIVNDSFNQEVQPELFAQLSLMERSVWMLYTNEGFSEAEISEITGLEEHETKQMLSVIRHKLYPMTVQSPPARKRYWLSAAAIFVGLVCSTFLYLKQTNAVDDSDSIVKIDNAIMPQGETLQQNFAQPEILVAPLSTIKSSVTQTPNTRKLPAPSIAPAVIDKAVQIPEKQDDLSELVLNIATPKLNMPSLPLLQTSIHPPISMQPISDMNTLNGIVLLDNSQFVNQPSTTFQKLRLALTPHSFANTDERISIAMLLPGMFLSGE